MTNAFRCIAVGHRATVSFRLRDYSARLPLSRATASVLTVTTVTSARVNVGVRALQSKPVVRTLTSESILDVT